MDTQRRFWLLLNYKLPAQPTARRVYVWRKLQRLGAVFWQDAVWVLPDMPSTREQFQWLTAEIMELGGGATQWIAQPATPEQETGLIQQFSAQADAKYQPILTALKKGKADLVSLSQQYQQARQTDYFQSKLGERVQKMLIQLRGDDNK